MPDEVVAQKPWEAPEGRVVWALRELRDALKGLGEGVEDSPIMSLTLPTNAYTKVVNHVADWCRHHYGTGVTDNGPSRDVSVLWTDIEIKTATPDTRIIHKEVYDSDVQGGYELNPEGRTMWYGLRVIEVTRHDAWHGWELKLAQPRERYRDARPDEASRAQILAQENEQYQAREAVRASRYRDTYYYDETTHTVDSVGIVREIWQRANPDIGATLGAIGATLDAIIDDELARPTAPEPVTDNDPVRTERLRTRAPTYQAEAQARGRVTSPRDTTF